MNAKHYVSLEAAKKLKELGYNERVSGMIDDSNYLHEDVYRTNDELEIDMHSCPSLLEAMDWLEERGISVNVYLLASFRQKGFTYCIAFADVKDNIYSNDNNEFFPDKYSAYHAAIIKALELL